MAGTSVASILSECHISASQEELLANLRGGWERSLHYSLDETPSQTFGFQSPRPSYEGEDGSESSEASESVDGEGNLGFMQEPVEWISPPSSPQANVGAAEGNDDAEAKENSSVAAVESDLSESSSQDWPGQMDHSDPQPNLGVSAEFLTQPALGVSSEFLTQPAVGVMDFQYTQSEDVEEQILRRETIAEAEFVPLRRRSLPLLSPILENSVIGVPVRLLESCIQPFTQAFESQLPEPCYQIQEPVEEQVQAIEGRNEIHHPAVLDKDRPGTEEPQQTQQGRGGGEAVRDAPPLDNDEFEMSGEQSAEERGGDELLPSGSQVPVDDTRQRKSTEHKQRLDRGTASEVPLVEVHKDSGISEKAQPLAECVTDQIPSNAEQVQRGNGNTSSPSKALKRVNGAAEELHGRQKRQRAEVPPARARSVPKTLMDVIRSRSGPVSSPYDECDMSILMQAGATFARLE